MKDLDKQLHEQEVAKEYKVINDVLKQAPDFNFSSDFTQKVFDKIAREERKKTQRYWLIMGAMVLCFLGLGFGSILYFVGVEGFSKMYDITIYATIIGLMVVVVQYLDERLLHKVQLT